MATQPPQKEHKDTLNVPAPLSRDVSQRIAFGFTRGRSLSKTTKPTNDPSKEPHHKLSDDKREPLLPNHQLFTPKEDLIAVKNGILGSYANLLLFFVPFGFISYYLEWNEIAIFFLNFFAMMPLASILGDATESLSEHLGETIGGLLNATFGNAVEIVIMILVLTKAKTYQHQGRDDDRDSLLIVVQTSLIGSIFSNALLVLGCAFVAHGFYYKESSFNVQTTSANVSLLMIASFVMIMPAPYSSSNSNHDELFVSRAAALVLLVMYGLLLFFVLYTHRDIMNPEGPPKDEVKNIELSPSPNPKRQLSHKANAEEEHLQTNYKHGDKLMVRDKSDGSKQDENDQIHNHPSEEEEDDDGELSLSLIGSIILLLSSTSLVAVLSEFLVDSIDGMSTKLNMSEGFVGIILLPIIGNAVEHITAIRMAMKDKMDIAISIAIGSATQVAMFVVPLAILISWMMNLDLALDFEDFEVQLFIYSSIILFALVSDGSSNWLEGAMLLCLYVLIGIAVWDQEFD